MEKRVYTIVELTKLISISLERSFSSVCVEGELSDCIVHSSGHCYFTLKDGNAAQLRGVMFRSNVSLLAFVPTNGMRVRVAGRISVYAPSGTYQLVANQMEDVGKGDLHRLYEELKDKFFKEGLFDEERKKPLPLLPGRVGVVTSPTSAALRDIINVLRRRFDNMSILVAPVKVQGATSARQVAGAIRYLNDKKLCDVIIVSRGGGSFEDLWSFSSEEVVRAVYASDIPVISAVGHNIDYPLCDFASDLRAPTPSAAAELVVAPKIDFEKQLEDVGFRQKLLLKKMVESYRERLNRIKGGYVYHDPERLIASYMQSIDNLDMKQRRVMQERYADSCKKFEAVRFRMSRCATGMVQDLRMQLVKNGNVLESMLNSKVTFCKNVISVESGRLEAFSPFNVLKRGYSITTFEDGSVVKSTNEVKKGAKLSTRVEDGIFDVEVL